jgi:hypothetical protein
MHTLKEIYDYFPKNIFNLKVIHHRSSVGLLCNSPFYDNKKIKLSDDMCIVQVNDKNVHEIGSLNKVPFENISQMIEIIVPSYTIWITKIEYLVKYMNENYNNLPEYILYLDGTDTLVLNDILNPKSMLDFYHCDVLFNVEPNYSHTGYQMDDPKYFDPMFTIYKEEYKKLNLKKYGVNHDRSLNGGVFLGKKGPMLDILKEAYSIMIDSPEKKYPYGTADDQAVFKFLNNKYYEQISCDVYNLYFLMAYPKSIESSENDWEHFEYFKKHNIHLYEQRFY